MPLSLLLQEMTAAFRYGARVLEPWTHLVAVEELLIDRARSAFLVHWWGPGLPLHGFHLRVVIVNIQELRKRYLEVKRAVAPDALGPNLTEPLFGLAGVAAGWLLTPGVLMTTAGLVVSRLSLKGLDLLAALKAIALRVLFLIFSPVLGAAVVGLSPALAAAGFVGYLQMGISNDPNLRALYDFLGTLARLLIAAARLIHLLLGPRSAVKNPVLVGLLSLADHLARLLPFGLAFIAVVVTRFGPLLLPLAAAVGAFWDLVRAIVDTIKFILDDLVVQFKAVFTGPTTIVSPLKFVLERITRPFSRISETVGAAFSAAADVLWRWYQLVRDEIQNWSIIIGPFLSIALAQDPVRKKIKIIGDALKQIGPSITPGPKSSSKGSRTQLDAWIDRAKAWKATVEAETAKFPAVPEIESPADLADRLGLAAKAGIPQDRAAYYQSIKSALPPVSPAVQRYVERSRHPTSAFALEQKALAAELGAQSPAEALARARAQELELRGLIQTVIGRVLPPELRGSMIDVMGAFESFDEAISLGKKPAKTAGKEKEAVTFPVRDLPGDNGLLRPVVQRLVVHCPSGRPGDLEEFVERLRKGLDRPYPAPA